MSSENFSDDDYVTVIFAVNPLVITYKPSHICRQSVFQRTSRYGLKFISRKGIKLIGLDR